MNAGTVLNVEGLRTYLYTDHGVVRAVDDVSLKVNRDETVALVGESGCGKSMTALSVMRLTPNAARIQSGQIIYNGTDLLQLTNEDLQAIRGGKLAMIYQDPMTFLNPVLRNGFQVSEVLIRHKNMNREDAREKVLELFDQLKISSPERVFDNYPHQLSGGMRQRVVIAMAIACSPDLLIADEPTTALDVSVQVQIMELLREIRKEMKNALMLITHDLGLVAENCDRVYVMYAGEIVETADVFTIFENPKHPYTRGLLKSTLSYDWKVTRFETIEGEVASLLDLPAGCRFQPRCKDKTEMCSKEKPKMFDLGGGHIVSCWLMGKDSRNGKKPAPN